MHNTFVFERDVSKTLGNVHLTKRYCMANKSFPYRIGGFHSGRYEFYHLLRYSAVLSACQPTFRRSVSHPKCRLTYVLRGATLQKMATFKLITIAFRIIQSKLELWAAAQISVREKVSVTCFPLTAWIGIKFWLVRVMISGIHVGFSLRIRCDWL
jgi:hypothetical protein